MTSDDWRIIIITIGVSVVILLWLIGKVDHFDLLDKDGKTIGAVWGSLDTINHILVSVNQAGAIKELVEAVENAINARNPEWPKGLTIMHYLDHKMWKDATGCHWCHRRAESSTGGHDGFCPVPFLASAVEQLASALAPFTGEGKEGHP